MADQLEIPIQTQAPKKDNNNSQIDPKIYLFAFIIFFVFIIGMGVLTRILPRGAYDRQVIDGTEYLVNGSYHLLADQDPLPVWRWFTAPIELLGTETGIEVTLLSATIMLIGGFYGVFEVSGLMHRFISFIVQRLGKRKYVLLTVISVLFILIGSTTGIVENFLLLIPLTVALSYALGWDSLVGVAMIYVAVTRGFAASTLNPYTVGLAQAIAGVPLYSGMGLRIVLLVGIIILYLAWLLFYARRVERNPGLSLMYAEDLARRDSFSYAELLHIEKRRVPFKKMAIEFGKGAMTFLPMIPLGAMIMSLSYILTEGHVLDTVIYYLSQVIAGSSPQLAAMQMLLATCIVEIFLPGSVIKAYALLPVFIPLGDLAGLSRQIVCLIYILGDSIGNMLYPTDMVLMVILGMIGSNYFKWLRWIAPFILAMVVFFISMILFAVWIGYN